MESNRSPSASTLAAFGLLVLFGGLNAIGVRYIVQELPPFWGAAIRFIPASLLLFALGLLFRRPLPLRRALLGTMLFGLLNVGGAYSFLYWGLQEVPAGLAQVILALVPLLTFFFANLHRQEPFRWRALGGGLLALGGIAIVFGDQLSANVPLASMLAVALGAACLAESAVIIKGFPRADPVTANAVSMVTGGAVLLGVSRWLGETRVLPAQPTTWTALIYLILIGSCAVFVLYLYVLKRWTASATSYSFVLFPFVTVAVGALLAGESVSPVFLLGGALVLAGVYVGAIAAQGRIAQADREPESRAAAQETPAAPE